MPVKGIDRVRNNFKAKVKKITEQKTNSALYAILSQGATSAALYTPVEIGNLINSQYAPQITQYGDRSYGHVGYTAFYAAFVHEAPGILKGEKRRGGKTGNYWDPSGEPKFLSLGFQLIIPHIPDILKAVYNV